MLEAARKYEKFSNPKYSQGTKRTSVKKNHTNQSNPVLPNHIYSKEQQRFESKGVARLPLMQVPSPL